MPTLSLSVALVTPTDVEPARIGRAGLCERIGFFDGQMRFSVSWAVAICGGTRAHNQYGLVIRVEGDRIAEVREHADTHSSYEVCLGTPEKRAGVHERRITTTSTAPMSRRCAVIRPKR